MYMHTHTHTHKHTNERTHTHTLAHGIFPSENRGFKELRGLNPDVELPTTKLVPTLVEILGWPNPQVGADQTALRKGKVRQSTPGGT